MGSSDPNPAYTALEAIRVAVRGGPPGDVVETISAEINDLGEAGDAVVYFRHLLEAAAMAAIMAGAAIERNAKAEQRRPDELYDDLRKAYEGFTL